MAYINLNDDCPRTGHDAKDCEGCPFLERYYGDTVDCRFGEESEEDIVARHIREDAAYARNIDNWREA